MKTTKTASINKVSKKLINQLTAKRVPLSMEQSDALREIILSEYRMLPTPDSENNKSDMSSQIRTLLAKKHTTFDVVIDSLKNAMVNVYYDFFLNNPDLNGIIERHIKEKQDNTKSGN